MLDELRVQRDAALGRVRVGLAVGVRPAGQVEALAADGLWRGQLAAHPVAGGHVAVVVLPDDVYHHRRALQDVGAVVGVEHRAAADAAPVVLLPIDIVDAGVVGAEVAVGVALVRQVVADRLGQVAQHPSLGQLVLVVDIVDQLRVFLVAGVVQHPVALVDVLAVQRDVLIRQLVFLGDGGQQVALGGHPVERIVVGLERAAGQRARADPGLRCLGLAVQHPGDRALIADEDRIERQVLRRHGLVLLAVGVGPVLEGGA